MQAEDGIRDLVRSRGLGDVYKRQVNCCPAVKPPAIRRQRISDSLRELADAKLSLPWTCLLYTSDAADERSSVDLGGRRIIKKKKGTAPRAGRR